VFRLITIKSIYHPLLEIILPFC